MKKISELATGIVLFIAGTALIGIGIYLLKDKIQFFTHSIKTEGIVIAVESSGNISTRYYHPVISFQAVDGHTYTFAPDTSTSAALDFNKGDKVTIRYLKENPQSAKLDSSIELWGLPLALLVAGIVVVLSGGGMAYTYINKVKLRKELPRNGKRLKLVGRVTSKSSNNRTEFVVQSDWLNPADSKMYTFTSDKIAFDPTSYIADRLIDVYIAPTNPKKKHYMDISFLPKKA